MKASKPRRRRRRRATTDDAPDPGSDADEPETGPLRRCVVTRERQAKAAMLRFVVSPEGRVVADVAGRLPGRGIWLSARRDVVETACTRGAFARAARSQVMVPPDLLSGLTPAIERRIGEQIGLARRAGQAVCGFARSREWLVAGRAALVIQAKDGSAEECGRLRGAAPEVPVVMPLDAETLGAVFGRDHVVHVALSVGTLAVRVREETARWAGLAATPIDGEGRPARARQAGRQTRMQDG